VSIQHEASVQEVIVMPYKRPNSMRRIFERAYMA